MDAVVIFGAEVDGEKRAAVETLCGFGIVEKFFEGVGDAFGLDGLCSVQDAEHGDRPIDGRDQCVRVGIKGAESEFEAAGKKVVKTSVVFEGMFRFIEVDTVAAGVPSQKRPHKKARPSCACEVSNQSADQAGWGEGKQVKHDAQHRKKLPSVEV